jgi:hypothetical protein
MIAGKYIRMFPAHSLVPMVAANLNIEARKVVDQNQHSELISQDTNCKAPEGLYLMIQKWARCCRVAGIKVVGSLVEQTLIGRRRGICKSMEESVSAAKKHKEKVNRKKKNPIQPKKYSGAIQV